VPKKQEITVYAPAAVVAAVDAHHQRCSDLGLAVRRSVAAEALCRLAPVGVCAVPRVGPAERLPVYAAPDVRGRVYAVASDSGVGASAAACALILAGAETLKEDR